MVKMVNVQIELTPEEHQKLHSRKGDRTLREILLKAVGVDFEPRRRGRPPRVSSHSVASDSAISDVHQVGGDRLGFDAEIEAERLKLFKDMLRRKREG